MYYAIFYYGKATDGNGDIRATIVPKKILKKFFQSELLDNIENFAQPSFTVHHQDCNGNSFKTEQDAVKFCKQWSFKQGGKYTFRDASIWVGYRERNVFQVIDGGLKNTNKKAS